TVGKSITPPRGRSATATPFARTAANPSARATPAARGDRSTGRADPGRVAVMRKTTANRPSAGACNPTESARQPAGPGATDQSRRPGPPGRPSAARTTGRPGSNPSGTSIAIRPTGPPSTVNTTATAAAAPASVSPQT